MSEKTVDKKYRGKIIAVSIIIPLVVGALFRIRIPGVDFSFLPPIYATINGVTAVTLLLALFAIKKKKMGLHKRLMQLCIFFSLSFLIMYVLYHMTASEVKYGDINGDGVRSVEEAAKVSGTIYLYLTLLFTHIGLSMVIIPMVLFTYVRALAEKFDKHRKLAKITFPIWLYVAVTGVVVYIFISPYSEIRRNFVEQEESANIEQVENVNP